MTLTDDIRRAAARVMTEAFFVRIDEGRLAAFARELTNVPLPEWDAGVHFYDGTEKTLMYLLLLDAVNFCFWPSSYTTVLHGKVYGENDGYLALAAALTRAFEEGIPLWDASYLARMSFSDLSGLFDGEGTLPLMEERHRHAVDLGETLLRRYGGKAAVILEHADGDATALAEALGTNFACYADRRTYAGREVPVYKRAQLCVSDIAGTFGYKGFGALSRLDELTCFADYRLPQLLRSTGVLAYADVLDRTIRTERTVPENSPEEVEIRCATIHAVELLKDCLAASGRSVSARELDQLLWEMSIRPGAVTEPFHRTITTSY